MHLSFKLVVGRIWKNPAVDLPVYGETDDVNAFLVEPS